MKCHICQSELQRFFQTKVLNKYDVSYWQCTYCQFVQTESPYWLDETYSRAIAPSDDGLIFRNLMLAQISKNIINNFFAKQGKFLDFGGGYGVFVRLMRDMRFTFFWQDQFCQNLFADGLESQHNLQNNSQSLQYELVTAWEVFEHFVNPLEEIEQLLKISPNILFSTEILPANNPQPDQWWYYAPKEGQHISIYTIKSLEIIAKKFNLNFYSNGYSIHLLTQKLIDGQLFQKLSEYNAQKLRQFLWQKQDYLKTLQLLENQDFCSQVNNQAQQLLESVSNSQNTKKPYFTNQQLGVNIAGFIQSELGIGEGVRSIIRAVETTNIPFVINNIDLPSHRNADTSYQKFSPDNPHPVNILQINANEVNTFMKRGVLQKYLNNHYNIGFWAWELLKFPPEWRSAITPFHEIWTYSDYGAEAIAQVAPIPVLRMMPSINLATPNLTKADLGLPTDKFIFLFMFDFFSRVQRKNPMAIIRAFKQAFDRNNQDVLLIIKCSNSQKFPAERQILIDLIDNYDSIKLIDGYFSKEQINALVYNCDCYVSLHRCEGFGLTMAEAMFYGKPVIATGYSSNIEFMNVANSFLVKYNLVEIDGNYGPYKKGDIWADPQVDHCSELMQYVVNNYQLAKQIGNQAAQDMKTLFNPQVVGEKIKERLTYISNLTNNFTILPRPSYQNFYQEFYQESDQIDKINIVNNQTTQIPNNTNTNLFPLVSICIPTYNGERFIAEALASAINQTYQPLEIIISDDHSQDQTVKIVQEFQAKNPQVNCRLLQHKNFGLVGNLNYCIEQAQGKYIKFLFQDDLLLPNCVSEMVKLAESDSEIGLVFSPRQVILSPDAENHENCLAAYRGTQNLYKDWANLQTIQAGQTLLSDPHWMQYRLNKIGEPTTVLIPKEVFQKIGKFDPNLQQLLDVDMWFRIMGHYKVGFVQQNLSQLRIHPRQQTQINLATGQNHQDYHRFYQKLLQAPAYSFLSADLKAKVSQKFSQINTKELTKIKNLISQYQSNPQTEFLLNRLRQIRQELANNLLNLIKFQSDSYENYINQILELHHILRNSGIKNEKLTVDEEKFIKEISNNLSGQLGINQTNQYPINILIFHLYHYAYQLPIQYQNIPIPKWFFPHFLQILSEHPIVFSDSDDLTKYQGFMEYFMNYLIGNVFSNQNAELGGIIAEFITFNLDLSSLIYFTSNSLENLANRLMEVRQLYWRARANNIDHPSLEKTTDKTDISNLSINNQIINCGIIIDSKNLNEKSILFLIPLIKSFTTNQYSLNLYICPRDYSSEVANIWKTSLKQKTDISIVELPNSLPEQIAQLRQAKLHFLFMAGNLNSVDDQVSYLAVHRLAKTQITHQVFTPVCIDSEQLDYYITGELLASTIAKYQTKVLTMSGAGFVFAPLPSIDEPNNIVLNPTMWGANQDTVIFMSCADIEKITPLVRETWVETLAGVDNSILVLSPCSDHTWEYQAHILLRSIQLLCASKNIATNRVFVTKHLGTSANMTKFLKLAHVYLDAFPYTGTQSLWQALLANLPVVVLAGEGIQTKQASGLLQELAIPELITNNPHDYLNLSKLLASNHQLRQTYRQRIGVKLAEKASFFSRFNYIQYLEAMQ